MASSSVWKAFDFKVGDRVRHKDWNLIGKVDRICEREDEDGGGTAEFQLYVKTAKGYVHDEDYNWEKADVLD